MRLAALAAVLGLLAACTVQPDPPDNRPRVEQVQAASINAPHGVEFKSVDDGSSYTKDLLQQVALDRQRSIDDAVAGDEDRWRTDDGTQITELYLTAKTPQQLAAFVADHGGPPPDREIVAGKLGPDRWRTYLVSAHAGLDGSDIATVDATQDPTGRPALEVGLTADGAQRLADLTSRSIGHKVAVIADGIVISAPIVIDTIRGGRLQITPSAGDEAMVTALAASLRSQ